MSSSTSRASSEELSEEVDEKVVIAQALDLAKTATNNITFSLVDLFRSETEEEVEEG